MIGRMRMNTLLADPYTLIKTAPTLDKRTRPSAGTKKQTWQAHNDADELR